MMMKYIYCQLVVVPGSIPGRDTLIFGEHLHGASGSQLVLLCNGWEATACELDLPSLAPLSVAPVVDYNYI